MTIDDIAFGGDGVGRCGEFVVFVPFVALGETVEVELIERKARFGRARLLRVVQPAPERVTPPCRLIRTWPDTSPPAPVPLRTTGTVVAGNTRPIAPSSRAASATVMRRAGG